MYFLEPSFYIERYRQKNTAELVANNVRSDTWTLEVYESKSGGYPNHLPWWMLMDLRLEVFDSFNLKFLLAVYWAERPLLSDCRARRSSDNVYSSAKHARIWLTRPVARCLQSNSMLEFCQLPKRPDLYLLPSCLPFQSFCCRSYTVAKILTNWNL